jgi:hypothetical protein
MSLLTSSGYSLGRRTAVCAATQRALQPGETVVSVLIEAPESESAGGFHRLDYALDAWESGSRPPAEAVVFAYWRSIQPEPGKSQRQVVSDEELVELFIRSGDGAAVGGAVGGAGGGKGDQRQVTFRYLLALLLIRRRLLSVVSTKRQASGDVMYARLRGRPDETLQVLDPCLDEETLIAETEALVAIIAPEEDPGDGMTQGQSQDLHAQADAHDQSDDSAASRSEP